MSFDKDTRNVLAKMVTACRRTLTEDVTNQLQETFGLYSNNSLPLDSLTHLTLDEAEAAQALREQLDHFAAAENGKLEERRHSAYDRLILEIAFTILNRLAALRLCEDRELVIECVRKGTSSDGFRLFNSISGGALGSVHETYRIFLECMMDELALDLGILFDRANSQSTIFPTERCLKDILDLLNDPDLASIWSEDETIGWIYQYFNPPEERRAMRDASLAPRNSRELAVRNQFFTPRYVVEFLTDNTLGRIWYEMRNGQTGLVEHCRYLVRTPSEVFLKADEEPPELESHEEDSSQEELLKGPVYIRHRPKKDPRDIKSLDPACGSAHFLLYNFDLMVIIYVEAWNDQESPASGVTGHTLREDYATLEALHCAIPELILRYNLHGIDIDQRAVQIAAFALWLRANRSWKAQGIKAKDRHRITKSNIVCAEPMPGEAGMLREFTENLKPKVLGQLVDKVFEKMKLAGEAGSLLKIEEEIQEAVAEANKMWVQGLLPTKQAELSSDLQQIRSQHRPRIAKREVVHKEFWDLAEGLIIDALKEYAEHAENGQGISRRLFAEDAARGFAFIDLCRKRFDVVLMNPPFGEISTNSLLYLSSYEGHSNNISCPFVFRATDISKDSGLVGFIIDKTVAIKSSYSDFRDIITNKKFKLFLFADLGWNVLDGAQVETALMVLSPREYPASIFLKADSEKKSLHDLCTEELIKNLGHFAFVRRLEDFSSIPNQSFSYDLAEDLWALFHLNSSLEPNAGIARQGLGISDSWRWFRLRNEVLPDKIANAYYPLANGGGFSPFFRNLDLLIYWENDGRDIKVVEGDLYGSWSRTVKNVSHYFKRGISFPKRTDFLNAHILPDNCIFSQEGLCFFSQEKKTSEWFLVGLFNSRLYQYLINSYCGQHKSVGYIKKLPFVPTRDKVQEFIEIIEHLSIEAFNIKRSFSTICTNSVFFIAPASITYMNMNTNIASKENVQQIGLGDTISIINSQKKKLDDNLNDIQKEIDLAVFDLFEITQETRAIICNETSGRPQLSSLQSVLEEADSNIRIWVVDLIEACLGYALGRWDIRIAIDTLLSPPLLDPLAPLPFCPPGMLVGPDGLPARSGGIASEEWLRARANASTISPEELVKNPIAPDSEYPLRVSWNGILVDDPGWEGGQPHRDDILRRVREVFGLLWNNHAQAIEQEACQILGVSDLRDYFRRPSGFFQDHLKRYSKSRRKAPIYWSLSTASGSYTIWLHYCRLTDQILYAVVNDYLEPKIAEMGREISRTEEKLNAASGREATNLRDKINDVRTLLAELRDLRQEIMRIASMPYKPDLNDGVIINAAPFHKLFRLRSWAEDTEEVWNKLENGKYDWSHLAYVLWPDRVQEACRKDRSIAIAHGLEDLFQAPAPSSTKGTRGKRNRRSKRAA